MGVLIDTDVLVELERGLSADKLDGWIGREERGISVVTVSELLHGVHRATGPIRVGRSAFVERLLAGLEAVPVTEIVARAHAELGSQMASRGERIGAHNLWIGATAVAHGFGVLTGNAADFGRIPGLRVIDARA